jgi:hypothetical protein
MVGYITQGEIPYGFKNLWQIECSLTDTETGSIPDTSIINILNNGAGQSTAQMKFLYDWNRDLCSVGYANGEKRLGTLSGYSNGAYMFTALMITNVDIALDAKEDKSNKGVAGGYMPLDASGKAPLVYLPAAILGSLVHAGDVDASTATATLTDNGKTILGTSDSTIVLTNDNTPITGYVANQGNYYIVTVAGLFAGLNLLPGDWLLANANAWSMVDNTSSVTGVKGSAETTYRAGNVNISGTDIASSAVSGQTTVDGALTSLSANKMNNPSSPVSFAPVIQGESVAGANQYVTQQGIYVVTGKKIEFALIVEMSLKDTVMAGGVRIPLPIGIDHNYPYSIHINYYAYLTIGAAYNSLYANILSNYVYFTRTGDNMAVNNINTSAISNNTLIALSGWYYKT